MGYTKYCVLQCPDMCAFLPRLEDAGYGVGLRLLELLHYRESKAKRETNLLRMLMFVHTTVWKYLFGKPAKDLEQSNTVHCFVRPFWLDVLLSSVIVFVGCWLVFSHHVLHMTTHDYTQAEDEYMISDYDLFVNQYISVPRDMGQLNCAAFVAGIVKGVLEGGGFPARYGH